MSLAIREVECIDREVKRCLNEIESEIQKMEQDHSPSEASKLSRKIEYTKSRIKTMEIELQTVESRETARKFKPVIRDHRSKVKEFEQMLLWIPKYKPISLNTHNISVKINQRYAKTIYSFNFENMNDINYGSSELMFEITIGVNAFISGFMANIDGEIFDGKTKEKQEANKEYMSAKTKDENAILISQPYDNISNVFLIKTNIDGQSNILLEITIEEYLAKKFDFNELNIEILRNFEKYNIKQEFDCIAIDININDLNGIFDVNVANMLLYPETTNENGFILENNIMNKNENNCLINGKINRKQSNMNEFCIKYKIKGEQTDTMVLFDNNTGTFCHIISDIIKDAIIDNINDINEGVNDEIKPHILIPRRVVFVIDKSGSMSGTKWIKTKAATIVALKQLRVNYDRGGIIFFDDYVERALPNLIPATEEKINEAINYVMDQEVGGSTNINSALLDAIKYIGDDIKLINKNKYDTNFYMNQIIFLTDGEANRGVTDTTQIILNIKNKNILLNDKYYNKISIFTFGIGNNENDSSWINNLNHSFLKLLALNNNGIYKRIKKSQCDTQLIKDFNILSKPMLSKINITYNCKENNITNITNTTFDTLYSGNDLIICGKYIKNNQNEEKKDYIISANISAISGKMIKISGKIITKPVNICKNITFNLNNIDINNENNNNIDRIWAYLMLQQYAKNKLIDNNSVYNNEGPSPLLLAINYRFVTPWTSMIVVKQKKKKSIVDIYDYEENIKQKEHKYPTPWDIVNNSSDAIQYGKRLIYETDCAADRAIRDLAETQEIAFYTAINLHDQTDQIALIDKNLAEIDDEIDRATRVIKRMSRRIMSDKYIWCLIILIILAIIAIIIGSIVIKNVPQKMKSGINN